MLPVLPDPIPMPWAARLIEKMQVLYGAKFAQQWGDIDPANLARCWAEELAGFSPEELRRGLDTCRSRDWPPTLPEFMKFCRPGIQPEAAYHEAVAGLDDRQQGRTGMWTHPAIYWAAVRFGQHDILNNGYAAVRARWERVLRDEFAKGTWNEVPAPMLALPMQGGTETTKEDATKRLKEFDAGGVLAKAGRDDRRWIGKIMARLAARQRVSPYAERLAREHLDRP